MGVFWEIMPPCRPPTGSKFRNVQVLLTTFCDRKGYSHTPPLLLGEGCGYTKLYIIGHSSGAMSLADELLADLEDVGEELGNEENDQVATYFMR